jgi:hypothetical protein
LRISRATCTAYGEERAEKAKKKAAKELAATLGTVGGDAK